LRSAKIEDGRPHRNPNLVRGGEMCEMKRLEREEDEDIIYFGPGLSTEEIDKKFDDLYKKLIEYREELFKLVSIVCPNPEDQVRLAQNIGETDGNLLPRLITEECEKRRLKKLKTEVFTPSELERRPTAVHDITISHEVDAVMVGNLPEMILEVKGEEPQPMLIHKSRCSYGKLGVIMFSICGDPIKGIALFIPDRNHGNVGTLHIFDDLGYKRIIKSNLKILDLDNYDDVDVYYPEGSDWSRERTVLEALVHAR
jgi:hypothetical protein